MALGGKIVSVFGNAAAMGRNGHYVDPRAQRWDRGPDGPIGQTYVQGAELGEAFYSIGGRSRGKGGVHSQCYRLNSNDGEYAWEQIAALNERRGWAPSVSVDERLYVFGGSQGGHGPTLSSVEMLDTSDPKSEWHKVAEIPGPSRGWSGAAAVGGKIYLIGGLHFFNLNPPTPEAQKHPQGESQNEYPPTI